MNLSKDWNTKLGAGIFWLSKNLYKQCVVNESQLGEVQMKVSLFVFCIHQEKDNFSTFPACFLIPNFFSNLSSNCSELLVIRNLQVKVKKAFCYQKMFGSF
jgi:hypothetical protein